MTELDNRVAITVSISDTSVTRPGFGIAAIVHKHGDTAKDRVETYLSLTALLVDFPSYTPVGLMATAFFSQAYTAESIKVIYQASGETVTEALDAAILVDSDFYGVLTPARDSTSIQAGAAWCLANDRLFIFASQDADCITSATTDPFSVIKALTNNRAAGYYTASAGAEIDITSITVSGTTATALTDATVVEGDVVHVWGSAVSALNAAWTVASASAGVNFTFTVPSGTSSDAAASKGYVNGNHIDAAIAGKMLPLDAGSKTWDLQQLSGVSTESLTGTIQGYLGGKYANWFTTVAGVNVTGGLKSAGGGGKTLSGRYIDIQRGADWLSTNLQLDLFQLMVNEGGDLGYDAIGFQKVETAIALRLDDGISKGFLTPFTSGTYSGQKYQITMPSLASIPTADKTARLLDGIEIYANIRGKIHNMVAAITLST